MTSDDRQRGVIFPMLSRRLSSRAAPFEAKDFLVSLPLIGSAIAVSWEVGSYIPIGLNSFGLFSLSEHLLFATQAVPVGLCVAALLPVLVTGVGNSVRRRRQISFQPRTKFRMRIGIAAGAIMFVFFATVLACLAVISRLTSVAVLSLGTATLGIIFGAYPPALILWPKQLFITFAAFALTFAMGVGCDQMRGDLNYADSLKISDDELYNIVVDGTHMTVQLLRAGDRGLLVYDKASRRLMFTKWEAVTGMDWSRRPLIVWKEKQNAR